MSTFEVLALIGIATIAWLLWALAKGLDAIEALLTQIRNILNDK